MMFLLHCSNIRIPAESWPRLYTPSECPLTQKSSAFREIVFRELLHIAIPPPDRNEQSLSYTAESFTRSSTIPFCPRLTFTPRTVTLSDSSTYTAAPYLSSHSFLPFACGQSQSPAS